MRPGRRYQGFGPRPELLPLRDGIVDVSSMTGEMAEHLAAITRRYPGPPVEQASRQPFVGITTDGRPVPGLFALEDTGLDAAPIAGAAEELWSLLDPAEREALAQDLDSPAWRVWTNAFPTWPSPHGLRLRELSDQKREAVLAVIRATLSTWGYRQAREAMRLNGELGRLVDQYHDTLTEWMYWFSVFGRPSPAGPWGWQLTGHHLDIHCLLVGRQLVLTPAFLGAEFESDRIFAGERSLGLELVDALSPDQRAQAVVHATFADLPDELQGPVDGRHLGGAGQDNRVIPYEGLRAGALTGPRRALFRRLVEAWVSRLPEGPAQARAREIERHLAHTHFAWFGPTSGEAAFYYRIHSPVVLIEYDNHPGIFLDNDDPEPFHVHTVVRTPNGNDYGRDLLRQHLAAHPH
jgi:Protein of unknown function (DUF3500)